MNEWMNEWMNEIKKGMDLSDDLISIRSRIMIDIWKEPEE